MDHNSSLSQERIELIERINWELRKLSTSAVLLASSIAHRVGMNASDLECAQLLARKGPMTAGQLGELSGLTTGAITGLVDRLEKAGWAKRNVDPKDRRGVVIESVPQSPLSTAGLYESYAQAMSTMLSHYKDREIALILEFIHQLSSINYEEAGKIQTGSRLAKNKDNRGDH